MASLLCFALAGCDDTNGYDKEFYELMDKAIIGDTDAANDAHYYCWSELKLDSPRLPYEVLGMCGGIAFLWIDNALMSGDPTQIKLALDTWMNKKSFAPRRKYYIGLALSRVKGVCSDNRPPISCNDPNIKKWLVDLERER